VERSSPTGEQPKAARGMTGAPASGFPKRTRSPGEPKPVGRQGLEPCTYGVAAVRFVKLDSLLHKGSSVRMVRPGGVRCCTLLLYCSRTMG
jgi:hypothetical protein